MNRFDAKIFNAEAFAAYTKNVPNLTKNELIKSRAVTGNPDIRSAFSSQTGTYFARIPMLGNIDGEPVNYDGDTDIEATSTTTFEQGVVVYGRAKAWVERDFSYDITGGVDFMDNVAKQIVKYWQDIDQKVMLSVLTGIFSMTGTANLKFVNGHTLDLSAETGNDAQGNAKNCVGPASLNIAAQKACGDNKAAFSLAIMHSAVATNLENLQLLKYLQYTDAEGIKRDLNIGTWNGRTVLVDDGMPTVEAEGGINYTTYVLGDGAFSFEDIGAKVPYEMDRDPKEKGGETYLYSRQRKCLAPKGISFKIPSGMGTSPTDAHFAAGANWELVTDGNNKHYDHKAIPIARIISRG